MGVDSTVEEKRLCGLGKNLLHLINRRRRLEFKIQG